MKRRSKKPSQEEVWDYLSTHLPPMVTFICNTSVEEQHRGLKRTQVLWLDDMGVDSLLRYSELLLGAQNRVVEMNRSGR